MVRVQLLPQRGKISLVKILILFAVRVVPFWESLKAHANYHKLSPPALVMLEKENLFPGYLLCLIIKACKTSQNGWVCYWLIYY